MKYTLIRAQGKVLIFLSPFVQEQSRPFILIGGLLQGKSQAFIHPDDIFLLLSPQETGQDD
jgi:hypothetical protein